FIKIFLVVSKDEQLKRFKSRLEDPTKTWKITEEDVRNRQKRNDYVKAGDEMIKKCSGWTVICSNDKAYARLEVLKTVTNALKPLKKDIPAKARKQKVARLTKELFKT